MFKKLKFLCEVFERCQTASATEEWFLCQNPGLLCVAAKLAGMSSGLAHVAYAGDFNLRPWEVGYWKDES